MKTVFIIMALVFGAYICWVIGMTIYSRATAEKRKEQEEREKAREAAERPFREKAFFDGCVQAGILSYGCMNDRLSDTAKTAIEIAKKCRLIIGDISIAIDNTHIQVHCEKENVPFLVKKLVLQDIKIYSIKEEMVSLEDAFLKKTGGNVID